MDFLAQIPGAGLLSYIVPFLVVLTIVVFFHELGHFLVARWNGVKVEAFSIGFGPEIWGFTDSKGTRWRVAAVPLGGYVRFFGDANESSAPDFKKAAAMSEDDRRRSFIHKKVWQRASIVVAGPFANFVLAIVIFSVIYMTVGRAVTDPIVASVQEGGPAAVAGIEAGDRILAINGNAIENFSDVPRIVAPNPGRPLEFLIERGGREIAMEITPRLEARSDRFGNEHEVGFVGIVNDSQEANFRIERMQPVQAVGEATGETWFIIVRTMSYLKDIVIGMQSADQLGGPIRIAKVSGEVATLGPIALLNLAAILSVSIGLLNLFPIPMLDGGHLVFYGIEALRGRPLSESAQEISFRIGLGLVLMLMVFATWNDISQIVLKSG
jgi:regulator of sigma E protease